MMFRPAIQRLFTGFAEEAAALRAQALRQRDRVALLEIASSTATGLEQVLERLGDVPNLGGERTLAPPMEAAAPADPARDAMIAHLRKAMTDLGALKARSEDALERRDAAESRQRALALVGELAVNHRETKGVELFGETTGEALATAHLASWLLKSWRIQITRYDPSWREIIGEAAVETIEKEAGHARESLRDLKASLAKLIAKGSTLAVSDVVKDAPIFHDPETARLKGLSFVDLLNEAAKIIREDGPGAEKLFAPERIYVGSAHAKNAAADLLEQYADTLQIGRHGIVAFGVSFGTKGEGQHTQGYLRDLFDAINSARAITARI
jgi:hypothetical protein